MQQSRQSLLLWFVVYITCYSLPTDATESLHHTAPSSRVKRIKPFNGQLAQPRLYGKRNHVAGGKYRSSSYLDNRIETFPALPDYSAGDRFQDTPPRLELSQTLHFPYSQDMVEDISLDYTMSPKLQEALLSRDQPRPDSADADDRRPLEDDIDFTSLLSPALDAETSVSESAKSAADSLLQDFLTFLELKASGALDECFRSPN
ncbi:hypothetical protein BsWGS_19175 [Bradybaena similaris]